MSHFVETRRDNRRNREELRNRFRQRIRWNNKSIHDNIPSHKYNLGRPGYILGEYSRHTIGFLDMLDKYYPLCKNKEG